MAIQTVNGPIPREKLGIALAHEHIFCDLRSLVSDYDEMGRRNLFYENITLENYGHVRRNPYAILDNALLNQEAIQEREVRAWLRAGGDSIVDATTRDFGRDPELLRAISRTTGVNIVMGCGRYVDASLSEAEKARAVVQIAEEMLCDLTSGVGESGIRAGVIGEIGTSKSITPAEYCSLEAAAIAQKETGAGMHIHAALFGDEGLKAARFVLGKGVDPHKICIDHVDVALDWTYIQKLLEMGVWIEFDNFGKEFYVDRRCRNLLEGAFASDVERAKAVARVADVGRLGQLLITNDICLKSLTHTYGGWGYDHIVTNIAPMLEDFGLQRQEVDQLLRKNPADFLDIP